MNNISLLDCTLRDGGYINRWNFSATQISSAIANLNNAGINYIEVGYLTSITSNVNGTQFMDMESVCSILPRDRNLSKYVVMADVSEFDTSTLCRRSAETVDGIRVVFYKRQIEQAYAFCSQVIALGYDLFLQPMVTMDYPPQEFAELITRFQKKFPLYSVAIVDSFGCMLNKEVDSFSRILDNCLAPTVRIGFHGHNNMNLAMQNALSFFQYANERQYIIDASAGGMGRGGGNLATELIASYCNSEYGGKYDISSIIQVISDVTEPISREHTWGYTPYLMLTALHRAHPNFATFLLANHNMSVSQFAEYLQTIPNDMRTRCTRPYVEELYMRFVREDEEAKQ